MPYSFPSYQEVHQIRLQLHHAATEHWLHDDLFSLSWWILIALVVITWGLWWRLVEKHRLVEIMAHGFLVAALSTSLDILGTSTGIWGYPTTVLPAIPPVLPLDFSVMPVSNMLLYQAFRPWKKFFAASLIMAAVFAFIAEPILEWLHIYENGLMEHVFSFIGYVMLALFTKATTESLLRAQRVAQVKGAP